MKRILATWAVSALLLPALLAASPLTTAARAQGSSAAQDSLAQDSLAQDLLAQEPTVKGFWQSTDDDGKPNGWFYFTEDDGVFEGRLVKGFPKPGEKGKAKTCDKCEGALKGMPILGLPIVTGMKRKGLAYEEGRVLDPRNGTIYDARMDISPEGDKLMLRGYVGISLLGQTKTWTRLPDNALPLAALPPAPKATREQ